MKITWERRTPREGEVPVLAVSQPVAKDVAGVMIPQSRFVISSGRMNGSYYDVRVSEWRWGESPGSDPTILLSDKRTGLTFACASIDAAKRYAEDIIAGREKPTEKRRAMLQMIHGAEAESMLGYDKNYVETGEL